MNDNGAGAGSTNTTGPSEELLEEIVTISKALGKWMREDGASLVLPILCEKAASLTPPELVNKYVKTMRMSYAEANDSITETEARQKLGECILQCLVGEIKRREFAEIINKMADKLTAPSTSDNVMLAH